MAFLWFILFIIHSLNRYKGVCKGEINIISFLAYVSDQT
ncbi:hypothetical protein KIS1582_1452 [Cytobacillus firmus]|uniref:Uncharacterized protein n=1 Tax=Cytobacillus firmus TaxID=1399 RepID=A0A800MYB1_CYTFI|nr:hypothetical protein KIS1582_1452 [Cytobacillus firmus]